LRAGRYRIRLPTDKEKEMKVTKEVAAQRYFESAILNGYQKFLQVQPSPLNPEL